MDSVGFWVEVGVIERFKFSLFFLDFLLGRGGFGYCEEIDIFL